MKRITGNGERCSGYDARRYGSTFDAVGGFVLVAQTKLAVTALPPRERTTRIAATPVRFRIAGPRELPQPWRDVLNISRNRCHAAWRETPSSRPIASHVTSRLRNASTWRLRKSPAASAMAADRPRRSSNGSLLYWSQCCSSPARIHRPDTGCRPQHT
jgi:hypothetical protein